MGHVIGAVVADTQLHAQRAAKAVSIQYEELRPIITIQVSHLCIGLAQKGVHVDGKKFLGSHMTKFLLKISEMSNSQEAIAAESFYQPIRSIQNGDLEVGFKQADHIIEGLSVYVCSFLQILAYFLSWFVIDR